MRQVPIPFRSAEALLHDTGLANLAAAALQKQDVPNSMRLLAGGGRFLAEHPEMRVFGLDVPDGAGYVEGVRWLESLRLTPLGIMALHDGALDIFAAVIQGTVDVGVVFSQPPPPLPSATVAWANEQYAQYRRYSTSAGTGLSSDGPAGSRTFGGVSSWWAMLYLFVVTFVNSFFQLSSNAISELNTLSQTPLPVPKAALEITTPLSGMVFEAPKGDLPTYAELSGKTRLDTITRDFGVYKDSFLNSTTVAEEKNTAFLSATESEFGPFIRYFTSPEGSGGTPVLATSLKDAISKGPMGVVALLESIVIGAPKPTEMSVFLNKRVKTMGTKKSIDTDDVVFYMSAMLEYARSVLRDKNGTEPFKDFTQAAVDFVDLVEKTWIRTVETKHTITPLALALTYNLTSLSHVGSLEISNVSAPTVLDGRKVTMAFLQNDPGAEKVVVGQTYYSSPISSYFGDLNGKNITQTTLRLIPMPALMRTQLLTLIDSAPSVMDVNKEKLSALPLSFVQVSASPDSTMRLSEIRLTATNNPITTLQISLKPLHQNSTATEVIPSVGDSAKKTLIRSFISEEVRASLVPAIDIGLRSLGTLFRSLMSTFERLRGVTPDGVKRVLFSINDNRESVAIGLVAIGISAYTAQTNPTAAVLLRTAMGSALWKAIMPAIKLFLISYVNSEARLRPVSWWRDMTVLAAETAAQACTAFNPAHPAVQSSILVPGTPGWLVSPLCAVVLSAYALSGSIDTLKIIGMYDDLMFTNLHWKDVPHAFYMDTMRVHGRSLVVYNRAFDAVGGDGPLKNTDPPRRVSNTHPVHVSVTPKLRDLFEGLNVINSSASVRVIPVLFERAVHGGAAAPSVSIAACYRVKTVFKHFSMGVLNPTLGKFLHLEVSTTATSENALALKNTASNALTVNDASERISLASTVVTADTLLCTKTFLPMQPWCVFTPPGAAHEAYIIVLGMRSCIARPPPSDALPFTLSYAFDVIHMTGLGTATEAARHVSTRGVKSIPKKWGQSETTTLDPAAYGSVKKKCGVPDAFVLSAAYQDVIDSSLWYE